MPTLPPKVPTSETAVLSEGSATSSEIVKPVQPTMKQDTAVPDDERPFYAPSMCPHCEYPQSSQSKRQQRHQLYRKPATSTPTAVGGLRTPIPRADTAFL